MSEAGFSPARWRAASLSKRVAVARNCLSRLQQPLDDVAVLVGLLVENGWPAASGAPALPVGHLVGALGDGDGETDLGGQPAPGPAEALSRRRELRIFQFVPAGLPPGDGSHREHRARWEPTPQPKFTSLHRKYV